VNELRPAPLQIAPASAEIAAHAPWFNQTLTTVNDAVVRHHGYTVPRGVVHRTRAPVRTAILMVEPAGVVPTGDSTP